MLPRTCYGSNISILVHHQIIQCFTSRWWIEWRLSQQKLLEPHYSIVVEAPIDPGTTSMRRLIDVCIIWDSRAQVLVKNSGRLQDFWFLYCHSSTQDIIALSILSSTCPTVFLSQNSFSCKLSFLCYISFWNCAKWQLKCQMVFFNWTYNPLNMILKCHFSFSQSGY